ncbi:methionine ABC transporter substrate-binding protein [Lysinibacillus alkalisoli]|uniref:Methionine ABC transporter substrate-binding protein n=1 Tax=Lysinibacillus alkalisoli TaxID=1911548 RepID=A0A917G890_9BACI|nr:MetQ/NlpA family ABC transporter substrate-binding protein [Lysinibacillus alkalisoli]GGG26887.1 methionine ABC transporter substrate-binding protein [Lysinibacillus alkalisoli]
MKKISIWLLISVLFLFACNSDKNDKKTELKVAASSIPHAEILEVIKEDLAQENIDLDIVLATDGIQVNQQTADGQLDANFFQHTPYLEQVNKDSQLDLVNVVGVHIEPFGVYSTTLTSIDDVKEGAKIAIPKDPVNFSRALRLLAANHIITLKETDKENIVLEDITKNDKNITFIAVETAMLNRSLEDVDAAAINTNYALEGGFNPLEDALIIEGEASPYVNILAATREGAKTKEIQILKEALTSKKVKDFILQTYEGAVIPAF